MHTLSVPFTYPELSQFQTTYRSLKCSTDLFIALYILHSCSLYLRFFLFPFTSKKNSKSASTKGISSFSILLLDLVFLSLHCLSMLHILSFQNLLHCFVTFCSICFITFQIVKSWRLEILILFIFVYLVLMIAFDIIYNSDLLQSLQRKSVFH